MHQKKQARATDRDGTQRKKRQSTPKKNQARGKTGGPGSEAGERSTVTSPQAAGGTTIRDSVPPCDESVSQDEARGGADKAVRSKNRANWRQRHARKAATNERMKVKKTARDRKRQSTLHIGGTEEGGASVHNCHVGTEQKARREPGQTSDQRTSSGRCREGTSDKSNGKPTGPNIPKREKAVRGRTRLSQGQRRRERTRGRGQAIARQRHGPRMNQAGD